MNPKEYRYTQEHEWLCPERGTQHPTWNAGGKHHRLYEAGREYGRYPIAQEGDYQSLALA